MSSVRRLLVTGATGCIGRALVPRLLAAGHEVHAVARSVPEDMPAGIHWHRADLLAPGASGAVIRAAAPEVLVHLAWYVAPGRWAAAPENADWLASTIQLVRAFCAAGGQRFIGAGSGLEYAWSYGYCTEDVTPCQPHTLYGSAKLAAWQVLQQVCGTAGVDAIWGRVFFVHGPHEHQDRLVPAVVRPLLRNEEARVSHGRQIRDYLHVDDVANAFAILTGHPAAAGVYNVSTGEPVALRTIIEEIGHQLGRASLVRFGAIPAAATDTPLVVGNSARLRSLGWSPGLDLADGLRATIEWWRKEEA